MDGWRNVRAGLVVVLVALPFCAGVTAACGVGFERGLLTAVVGGLVVGSLGGARLQISGPAVSMGVVLAALVARHGVAALGPTVFIAGIFQLLAAGLRLGGLAGMLPRAVLTGAVCAAGLIQAAAQAHGAIGAASHGGFVDNLMDLPAKLAAPHLGAVLVAGVCLAVALFWDRAAPRALREVPGAVAAVAAALAADWLAAKIWPGGVAHLPAPGTLPVADARVYVALLGDPALWAMGTLLGAMGMAESLASAEATALTSEAAGRLRPHRELFAQGVGNIVCGLMGALPLAGAIPRSAANARAGATGPASNLLHAAAIGLMLAATPWVLPNIPVPALAALLMLGGWRLAFERSALTAEVLGAEALGLFMVTLAVGLAVDVPAGIAAGGGCATLMAAGRQALAQFPLRSAEDPKQTAFADRDAVAEVSFG